MKQRALEIMLQDIPAPTQPDPAREQYLTPAPIAADLLYTALRYGDIADRTVLDLGCGTGIFAVGAALLGARHVTGIDSDPRLIDLAKAYADIKHLDIDYEVSDIDAVKTKVDTVLMNPPFGAQKANRQADRRFLEKGFEVAAVIYSLHLTKTIPFLRKMIAACNGEISLEKGYTFPIPAQFSFHTKIKAIYDVTLVRIITTPP